MAIDIAYIVSHGFAARMVMQTDLLGKLVKEGKTVALITPDAKDKNLVEYCRSSKVGLYEFNPENNRWTSEYTFARKYFLEDIKANPALWEKHVYSLRNSKSGSIGQKIRPRLLYAAYWFSSRFSFLRNWYRQSEQKLLESPLAEKLLREINPKLLVATYPVNFPEGMLLKAAKKMDTKTVIHLLSWDNISCKGHFPELADEYIAWGPIMAEELKEYYNVAVQNIHICGVPHFDLHIKTREQVQPAPYLKKLGLAPNKPYLFFGMSSPRFAPHEIDIVEWLADQVRQAVFGKEMQLIVRPHPQNISGIMSDKSWLPRLKKLANGPIAVDYPNLSKGKLPWSMEQQDMERMSQLLCGATLSYNSGSTLSIDALMGNTPVIMTSFDGNEKLEYWSSARRLIDYTHLKKLLALGGISVVHNYDELRKNTLEYIQHTDKLLEKRQYTIQQECANYRHGDATEKCLNRLITLSDE